VNQSLTKIGIIAIVDDDEPLREALGSVLKAAGFLIDTFASAEEFLEFPLRREIACLILDIRLPGMSGIELQRRLSESGCTIPIIFVTAHGDASLRDMLLKAGAAGFLNKPVRSDSLLREIYAALEKSASDEHS
jgi:two-component system, LuxR family, response regulator FixJ